METHLPRNLSPVIAGLSLANPAESVGPASSPAQLTSRAKSGPSPTSVLEVPAQVLIVPELRTSPAQETERRGFEPLMQGTCIRHFQCRSFSHSDTSPEGPAS